MLSDRNLLVGQLVGADLLSIAQVRFERLIRDVEGPVTRNITLIAYVNMQLISPGTKRLLVGTYT